jgi:hypothetical protein
MSNKSKAKQGGAFGGLRGRRKRAQIRYLAERGKSIKHPSLPGARLKIKEDTNDTSEQ